MKRQVHKSLLGIALVGTIVIPDLVLAQQVQSDDPDPNLTVQKRPREDYDPLGTEQAPFLSRHRSA